MLKRLSKKKQPLPTVAVGGSLPTKEETKKIEEDLKVKIEKYKEENIQKPEIEEHKIDDPLKVKNVLTSFDNEYIELAKRYLKIPSEKTDNIIVDFAKAIIKLINDNIKLTELIKNNRFSRDMTNKPLRSFENSSSWN